MKNPAPLPPIPCIARRIFALLAIFVAVLPALCTSHAEEVPDDLVKLRATFDKDIEFSTRPIRDRYVSRLEGLKRTLGSRGDARGAAAVQDEIDRMRVAAGGPGAFAKFAGTWKVLYSNGQTRRYAITPEGIVTGTDFDEKTALTPGKLLAKGSDVILEFNSTTIERLKVVEKNLVIEHFSPRSLYPGSAANYHGTGHLVSVQRD